MTTNLRYRLTLGDVPACHMPSSDAVAAFADEDHARNWALRVREQQPADAPSRLIVQVYDTVNRAKVGHAGFIGGHAIWVRS